MEPATADRAAGPAAAEEPAAAERLATAEPSATEEPAAAENGCAPSPAWDPAREITEELESAWTSESALSPRRPEAFSSADVQCMVVLPPYLAAPTVTATATAGEPAVGEPAVGEPAVAERMPVATPMA